MYVQVSEKIFADFLNPLRCNEVLFGVTSIDPLFSLSADEVTLNAGHRMTRLAGHILQQQSFYPCFPAPNNTLAPVRKLLSLLLILISLTCDMLNTGKWEFMYRMS